MRPVTAGSSNSSVSSARSEAIALPGDSSRVCTCVCIATRSAAGRRSAS
ncbi:hypothetical protein [Rothia halotolerans]|nr:hypothetical protein [Rothia halotolerans]